MPVRSDLDPLTTWGCDDCLAGGERPFPTDALSDAAWHNTVTGHTVRATTEPTETSWPSVLDWRQDDGPHSDPDGWTAYRRPATPH